MDCCLNDFDGWLGTRPVAAVDLKEVGRILFEAEGPDYPPETARPWMGKTGVRK